MQTSHQTLEEHVAEFKEQGFTLFPKLFLPAQIERWKAKFHAMQEEMEASDKPLSWWYGDMVERAPSLMLPAVASPEILDFAEQIMGPFVQLDNLTLAGFPSCAPEQAEGKVSGWHRDRWGQLPQEGVYVRPNAINAITYLQDLTPEYGPLRVIPGSHRRHLGLSGEASGLPHSDEIVLDIKAGDVAVIHNCLIHSGTPNISGKTRFFFSVFYNLTWLRTTDNHNGPNVQTIIKQAREANDLRTLRLFGVDEQLTWRANSGFQRPDEELWAEWAAADKAALKTASASA